VCVCRWVCVYRWVWCMYIVCVWVMVVEEEGGDYSNKLSLGYYRDTL